jgi:hypothetical protein
MKTMTSTQRKPAYRAAPTASQSLDVAAQQSETGHLAGTAPDSTGLGHHENLTTLRRPAKLSARAAVRALPAIDIDSLPKNDHRRVAYFMRASNGLVKIGQSQGLRARLRAQRSSYPEAIDLLGYAPVPYREIERAMHATLEGSHHHGEWFRPSRNFLLLLVAIRLPAWKRRPDEDALPGWDRTRRAEEFVARALAAAERAENTRRARRFEREAA